MESLDDFLKARSSRRPKLGAIRIVQVASASFALVSHDFFAADRARILKRRCRHFFTDFYRFLPIFRTFLGDFTPGELDSRSL